MCWSHRPGYGLLFGLAFFTIVCAVAVVVMTSSIMQSERFKNLDKYRSVVSDWKGNVRLQFNGESFDTRYQQQPFSSLLQVSTTVLNDKWNDNDGTAESNYVGGYFTGPLTASTDPVPGTCCSASTTDSEFKISIRHNGQNIATDLTVRPYRVLAEKTVCGDNGLTSVDNCLGLAQSSCTNKGGTPQSTVGSTFTCAQPYILDELCVQVARVGSTYRLVSATNIGNPANARGCYWGQLDDSGLWPLESYKVAKQGDTLTSPVNINIRESRDPLVQAMLLTEGQMNFGKEQNIGIVFALIFGGLGLIFLGILIYAAVDRYRMRPSALQAKQAQQGNRYAADAAGAAAGAAAGGGRSKEEMMEEIKHEREMIAQRLTHIKPLADMCHGDQETLAHLSHAFRRNRHPRGEVMVDFGQPVNTFYLIHEGSVTLELPDHRTTTVQQWQYFGTEMLSHKRAGPSSIRVVSDGCACLSLSRRDLLRVLRQHNYLAIVAGAGRRGAGHTDEDLSRSTADDTSDMSASADRSDLSRSSDFSTGSAITSTEDDSSSSSY